MRAPDPPPGTDPDWLASPAARGALHRAGELLGAHPDDPLAVGAALRRERPDLAPGQAAAALEQATLRRLASQRYSVAADDLLLTREGLEQATGPQVAARRARLLRSAGARRVVDLTGGLGFDARAMLAEGLAVTAVEADPLTASLLAHNAPGAAVRCADATDPRLLAELLARLGADDVVFVDPARRDRAGPRDLASGRTRPERDPARWSPPWAFVAAIPHPRIAAKVAPAFRPPPGWQAEWVSVHRTVVECSLYSWPIAGSDRRAVVLADGLERVVTSPSGAPIPTATAIGAWLHEPDPAVLRAGVVPGLIADLAGTASVDASSSWLTGDLPPKFDAAVRSYRVVSEVTGSTKEQRRILAAHGVSSLTVKSRDVDVDPRKVLARLGIPEGSGHVLVLTRRAGRLLSLLTDPAVPRSG